MNDDDFDALPDHPLLGPFRAAYRQWLGIPEVHIMEDLIASQNKTPDQLREMWGQTGMYEGGIDYEKPDPPSGADGLTVVELKQD